MKAYTDSLTQESPLSETPQFPTPKACHPVLRFIGLCMFNTVCIAIYALALAMLICA